MAFLLWKVSCQQVASRLGQCVNLECLLHVIVTCSIHIFLDVAIQSTKEDSPRINFSWMVSHKSVSNRIALLTIYYHTSFCISKHHVYYHCTTPS